MTAGPYIPRQRLLGADLPGPGDLSGPADPDDVFEPGPWLCADCGHESRFPYCYCRFNERRAS